MLTLIKDFSLVSAFAKELAGYNGSISIYSNLHFFPGYRFPYEITRLKIFDEFGLFYDCAIRKDEHVVVCEHSLKPCTIVFELGLIVLMLYRKDFLSQRSIISATFCPTTRGARFSYNKAPQSQYP